MLFNCSQNLYIITKMYKCVTSRSSDPFCPLNKQQQINYVHKNYLKKCPAGLVEVILI